MQHEELLKLMSLSHVERLQQWNGQRPWEGLRLPKKIVDLRPGHIQMRGGDIVRMPLLIGRPCFGEVTAFLRHGGHQPFWNPRTKMFMDSRCMRCPVQSTCEFVASERLRATPEIDAAYRAWLAAGGRKSTWIKQPGYAAHRYRDLLRLLETQVRFTNVNNAAAAQFHQAALEQAREKDRLRQQAKRLRIRLQKLADGEFDPEVESILEKQRVWRMIQFRMLKQHAECPNNIRRTVDSSAEFDSWVWMAKTRIELRSEAVNPYRIAQELHRLGRETGRSVNALRDAVSRTLRRIATLERLHIDQRLAPVWPRFGKAELRAVLEFNTLPMWSF